MDQGRPGGLLAWQYHHYPEFHGDRQNLLLHVLTVPLFQVGTLLLTAPLWGPWWMLVVGIGLIVGALFAQGRGHALEANPPVPFASRAEAIARLVLEQWINFPRFVVSGGFARAWRGEERGENAGE